MFLICHILKILAILESEVQFKSGATCEVAKQTVDQAIVMDGDIQ